MLFRSKPLALGLIDARNAKLEEVNIVARQIEQLMPKIQGGRAYLGTSSGLGHLPREAAYKKIALLSKVRATLHGHS